MGLFAGNKNELLAKLIELEKQNAIKDHLLEQQNKEVEFLRNQVSRLQDAVLAVQHPQAFKELRDDQLLSEEPEGLEEKEGQEPGLGQVLEHREEPFFKDVDDMMDALSRMCGIPESPSVHENSES